MKKLIGLALVSFSSIFGNDAIFCQGEMSTICGVDSCEQIEPLKFKLKLTDDKCELDSNDCSGQVFQLDGYIVIIKGMVTITIVREGVIISVPQKDKILRNYGSCKIRSST